MPTFTSFDNDNTEIDPEHLEVKLTDIEPEPETGPADLHIGTQDESEAEAEKESQEESVDEFDSNDEKDLNEDTDVDDSEEKEKEERVLSQKNGADKVFLILIGAAVLSAILFICFFSGVFNSKDSLNISLESFQQAYTETSGYRNIAAHGFSIRNTTFQPGDTLENASFSVTVENTLAYQMGLSGVLDTGKNQIQQMRVMLILPTPGILDIDPSVYSVFVPYMQVLFPDLSDQEAQNFLKEIYEKDDQMMEKGRFKFIFTDGGGVEGSFINLILAGKDDPIFSQTM